ncbi:hypothetical protein HWV62_13088 [Athelia sp. TMB]|nr:hypothetical protein HWV62_13088 [Athelia sp. TMB]
MNSTAIKTIREGSAPGSAQAYFFFDSRSAETDQSLHHNMLRSLIKQLSRRSAGMPAALIKMYDHGDEKPSLASLQLTLSKLVAGFEHTYIVIDALDECTDRGKLLTWIGDLLRQNMNQLHILFSSRREPEIVRCFEPIASITHVSLAGASTNADIETYVDAMLAKVTSWDTKTRARVKSALMKGADGMFRWVALQIAELSKCLTRRAVNEQLRSLPKDLDEMYERSLSRSANRHELKQLLIWLAFSVRHLRLEELADVTAIDFSSNDTPTYDPDLLYFSPMHVLDLCAGFVTLIPIGELRWSRSSIEDQGARILGSKGTVKLAHMSVKDYLVSDRIKAGAASFFGVDAILAHNMITATCLAYLLHLGSHSSFDNATFEHFPLVLYAAQNWRLHVGWGRSKEAPVWQLMIRMFSRGHNALTNCIRLKDPHRHPRWGGRFYPNVEEIKSTPPLYYASLLGMEELVKEILIRGEDVQVRGGPCGNALQAASYHGHEGVVRILLEHGANVNTRCGRYSNALRASFHGGHTDVARLLLEHKADVTVREDEGTLLHEAVRHDDSAAALPLLKHGADANARVAGFHSTAPQHASRRGIYALDQLLPENGAHATVLQIAASLLRSDIVPLLLEHGAYVNAQAGPNGTALQAAICWADPDMLPRRARPRNMDPIHPSLIRKLPKTSPGSYAIVRLLLERGAAVNAPAGPIGTALQIASGRGEIDMVRLLLDRGADVDAPAGPIGTALQAAISWARSRELSRRSIGDSAIRPMNNLSPRSSFDDIDELESARSQVEAYRRGCAIVRLLLEHGADVNALAGSHGPPLTSLFIADGLGRTALQMATRRGGFDIVHLLLEHGEHTDDHVPGGSNGTAWQVVRRFWSHSIRAPPREISRLLLEKGANANALKGPPRTDLDEASHRVERLIWLMLECGVVMEPKEVEQFIFSRGSRERHTENVKLLLDSGAVGVDRKWLSQKRVEWKREGRIG